MQALEKKGNLTSRYAKKKKKAGLGFSFDSYISIQDVDGRALGSQGVKEKKKKNVCSTVCRGWGIGHSFKRQVFFSFFFFSTTLILLYPSCCPLWAEQRKRCRGLSKGKVEEGVLVAERCLIWTREFFQRIKFARQWTRGGKAYKSISKYHRYFIDLVDYFISSSLLH